MIRLFQCYRCWYVFDDAVLSIGAHQTCECGETHFKRVAPSLWNVFKYVYFHKLRAIKRILEKEHV